MSALREGQRVQLARAVSREGPGETFVRGLTGTVTETKDYVAVRLDDHYPSLEEWDNELIWALWDDTMEMLGDDVVAVKEEDVMADRARQIEAQADEFVRHERSHNVSGAEACFYTLSELFVERGPQNMEKVEVAVEAARERAKVADRKRLS